MLQMTLFLGNVDSIKIYQKNLDGVEIVLVLYVNTVSNWNQIACVSVICGKYCNVWNAKNLKRIQDHSELQYFIIKRNKSTKVASEISKVAGELYSWVLMRTLDHFVFFVQAIVLARTFEFLAVSFQLRATEWV